MKESIGVQQDVHLLIQVGLHVHAGVGDDHNALLARHVEHPDVAEDPLGAEAIRAGQHALEEDPSADRTLEEKIRPAVGNQLARLVHRLLRVGNIVNRKWTQVDLKSFSGPADLVAVADKDALDQPVLQGRAGGFQRRMALRACHDHPVPFPGLLGQTQNLFHACNHQGPQKLGHNLDIPGLQLTWPQHVIRPV
jgi:hypothetical protein